jgi:hypothetical protein
MMGLGGVNSWGYLPQGSEEKKVGSEWNFRFWMRELRPGDEDDKIGVLPYAESLWKNATTAFPKPMPAFPKPPTKLTNAPKAAAGAKAKSDDDPD